MDGGSADAAPTDITRPQVIGSTPESGAVGVAVTTSLEVTFDEPMDTSVGTVGLAHDGTDLPLGTPAWNAEGTGFVLTPSAPLPGPAQLYLRVGDDFADVAGNTLGGPVLIAFETGDGLGPVVVETTPANGATDVSALTEEVVIRFDQTLDRAAGSLALSGGAGTVGAPVFRDDRTVVAPLEGLTYETSYVLTLDGFQDPAGNAMEASDALTDGAIVFDTGADTDAPTVVDSNPAEGQVNVATLATPELTVVFSERMDTSVATVELDANGTLRNLPATWSADAMTLTLPAAGFLSPDGPHALRLGGLTDAAGNPLDPAVKLGGDGELDFVTGADDRDPIAVFSEPFEGSTTRGRWNDTEILVVFDRAMDPSITDFVVQGPAGAIATTGSWNLSGTELRIDVTDQLVAATTYRVDLSGLVDLTGRPLDRDHEYLVDGALDFTTAPGAGEQCRDVLTTATATTTPEGALQWVLDDLQVVDIDGAGATCALNAANLSADSVIRVEKTTASATDGGTYLHVNAESATSDRLLLDVHADVCDPTSDASRIACTGPRTSWDHYLDVGPGTYYIWVANEGSGRAIDFAGATVTVDEVAATPEGESCDAPITSASASHSVGVGGESIWTIGPDAANAQDMTRFLGGEGVLSCDADGRVGPDLVLAVDKTTATSILSLSVEGSSSSSLSSVSFEVLDACDPRAATRNTVACETDVRNTARRVDLRGAAGTYYVWIGSYALEGSVGDLTVTASEHEPLAGESCETAIPVGPASTAITPTSTQRFDAPSCDAGESGLTWYRFTSTERATRITTDVPGAVAVYEASSRTERACVTDSMANAMAAFAPTGTDICVAVSNEFAPTQLTVTPVPYTGVLGIPTELNIGRPLDAAGNELSLSSARWMSVTPTTLHVGLSSYGYMSVPKAGNARAILQPLDSWARGVSAVNVGEALFALEDTGTGAGAPADATRLYRLIDSAGTIAATPADWDGATVYPASTTFTGLAYDGTQLWVTNDYRSSGPVNVTFYSADPTSPGLLVNEGAPTAFTDAVATAASATHIYVMGAANGGVEGIFRVAKADLATNPTPELVVAMDPPFSRGSIALDDPAAPSLLYFRDRSGAIHVVADPGGTPSELGIVSTIGRSGNEQFGYDPAGPAIYLFENASDFAGNFVRLD